MVVAPLERLSAEIIGGEGVALNVRSHGAVEHEHSAIQRVEVAPVAVGKWLSGCCRGLGHDRSTMKMARMRERRAGALANVLRGRKLP